MNALKAVLNLPLVRSARYSQFGPLPNPVWNIDNRIKTKYTPDVGKLEQKLAWLLFAYDDYQDGFDYNIYTFTQARFKMWRQDLGSASQLLVPVPVSDQYRDIVQRPVWADPNLLGEGRNLAAAASRIRGKLHLVSPEMLISLDNDMQNTVRFERIRVPLYYPHQRMIKFRRKEPQLDNVVGTVWAWMYAAKADYWEPLIDDPDKLGLFKAAHIQRPKSLWIGDFYTNSRE